MSSPVTIAAVVVALFAMAVPAVAQRAVIPATLTEQDVRWLNDYCSKRGSTPGTEAHKRCFDAKAKEILDQREADQRYRPNPV